jgi:hypothetical protein
VKSRFTSCPSSRCQAKLPACPLHIWVCHRIWTWTTKDLSLRLKYRKSLDVTALHVKARGGGATINRAGGPSFDVVWHQIWRILVAAFKAERNEKQVSPDPLGLSLALLIVEPAMCV